MHWKRSARRLFREVWRYTRIVWLVAGGVLFAAALYHAVVPDTMVTALAVHERLHHGVAVDVYQAGAVWLRFGAWELARYGTAVAVMAGVGAAVYREHA